MKKLSLGEVNDFPQDPINSEWRTEIWTQLCLPSKQKKSSHFKDDSRLPHGAKVNLDLTDGQMTYNQFFVIVFDSVSFSRNGRVIQIGLKVL